MINTEDKTKEEDIGASANPVLQKKRGRKPKNSKTEFQINLGQTKFFVDLSKEKENLKQVFELLKTSNQKDFGKEITFKDLALFGIEKITMKDIEKIQENSLSKRELLQRAWIDFNKKNKQNLSFDDFLLKKVGIN